LERAAERPEESGHPGREFPHECYGRALDFVCSAFRLLGRDPAAPGVRLVHGLYWGVLPHGWAELPGGEVFDGVRQKFYRREGYYRVTAARDLYRYTPFAVFALYPLLPWDEGGMLQGHWHAALGLDPLPGEPRTVDYEGGLALARKAGWKMSEAARQAFAMIEAERRDTRAKEGAGRSA
jgi:hypothetical protein